MIVKTIEVDFDINSFPGAIVPSALACSSPLGVNVTESLLMLGNLTTPSGFGIASPARYWAWLRYFAAVHSSPDLRVSGAFVDLDPHQKTILSDDFGVAITTRWLHERLGGFADIVDGRRFLAHFGTLLSTPMGTSTPKVGVGKCPDYVVLDHSGKWHVVECKGTQKSLSYRDSQIKAAIAQKKIIDVAGSIKGETLALGVFLANERQTNMRSALRIVDPEVDAYATITEKNRGGAQTIMTRLATARAFALAGFDHAAEELGLPSEVGRLTREEMRSLFSLEERRRLIQPVAQRWQVALGELREFAGRREFEVQGRRYVGVDGVAEVPGDAFRQNTGCSRIRLRQGVSLEQVERLGSVDRNVDGSLDDAVANASTEAGVVFRSDGRTTALQVGELFAAELEFLP